MANSSDGMMRLSSRFATYTKRANLLHLEIRCYRRARFQQKYNWDPVDWADADLGVASSHELKKDTRKWLAGDFVGNYEEFVYLSFDDFIELTFS